MQKLIPLCLLKHTTTVYILQLPVKRACSIRLANEINYNLLSWTIQVVVGQDCRTFRQRVLNYDIVAKYKKLKV